MINQTEAEWEVLDSISKSTRWIGTSGKKFNAYKVIPLSSNNRETNIVVEAIYISPRGRIMPTGAIADDILISNEAARVLFDEEDLIIINKD